MKKNIFISVFVISLTLMSFADKKTSLSNKIDLIGAWDYSVPEAAYEYQEGSIIFEEIDGELSGYIMVEEYKTVIEDIQVDKNDITFYLYLENEDITFKLKFKDNTFSGIVSYSGGELSISGEKKKE